AAGVEGFVDVGEEEAGRGAAWESAGGAVGGVPVADGGTDDLGDFQLFPFAHWPVDEVGHGWVFKPKGAGNSIAGAFCGLMTSCTGRDAIPTRWILWLRGRCTCGGHPSSGSSAGWTISARSCRRTSWPARTVTGTRAIGSGS